MLFWWTICLRSLIMKHRLEIWGVCVCVVLHILNIYYFYFEKRDGKRQILDDVFWAVISWPISPPLFEERKLTPALTDHWNRLVQFSSVAQLCPTLCNPMNYSTPGFPVHHQAQSLLKLMPNESVMPSNHLILCCPLLLLPSIFPSIRIFSKESFHIRWPKYWSFSSNISPSNEHPGFL